MECNSWKGLENRNRHKIRIKKGEVGELGSFMSDDVNHNCPTTWSWARRDDFLKVSLTCLKVAQHVEILWPLLITVMRLKESLVAKLLSQRWPAIALRGLRNLRFPLRGTQSCHRLPRPVLAFHTTPTGMDSAFRVPTGSPSRGVDVTVCVWKCVHSCLFSTCVYFYHYGPFNCISFRTLQRLAMAIEYEMCWSKLMSPDIILCGWLGLKHQLTK